MFHVLIATGFLSALAPTHQPSVFVDGIPTARVSYADLDLHSTAGRSRMARRIRSAAEDLCKDNFVDVGIVQPLRNDCYTAAVASGVTQVDAIAAR
jgi:UrcA family protein